MAALVASGLFQYPFITCGPAMQISPVSPAGSTLWGSSRSTMTMSVPGSGRPMEPSLLMPTSGPQVAVGEHSVRP